MCQAQEEDKKIEPPHHLQDTSEGVVVGRVEKREIVKACHPQVASDHDPNTIIYLRSVRVMIHQECQLHPTFPFIGLAMIQNFIFW